MNLTTRADRRYIRSGYRSNRYVLVDITAPTSRRTLTRDPLNTAFVLDRSGSMSGPKIMPRTPGHRRRDRFARRGGPLRDRRV